MKAWSPEVRLIDIERIEALPGPQGTLYGASSQSGTLRYITNKPDPTGFHADLSLDGYTADHGDEGYELSGVLNLPLGEKAAIRLVGFSARDAGYIDNVLGESLGGTFDNADAVEKDANAVEYLGGRAALRWLAGEKWTVDLGVVHQELDRATSRTRMSSVPAASSRACISWGLPQRRLDPTRLDLTGRSGLGPAHFGNQLFQARHVRSSGTAPIGRFSIRISCRTRSRAPMTCECAFAFGPDPKSHYECEGHHHWFTQEFRLRGATERVTWLGGLFYQRLDHGGHFFRHIENYEETPAFDFWNREYGVQPGTTDNADQGYQDKELTDQIAAFGEASYSPDERWSFTAGLRWFEHSRERWQRNQQPKGRESNFYESKASTDDITKKLSVQYNINGNAMVYALFSDGFRAGGRNFTAPGVVLPADFDPDFVDNYELGFKSRWEGGRYTFNLTAFRMKWKDYQAEVVDPGATRGLLCLRRHQHRRRRDRRHQWRLHGHPLGLARFGPQRRGPRSQGDTGQCSHRHASWRPPALLAGRKRRHVGRLHVPREIAGGHVYGRFQWTYTGNRLNGIWQPAALEPAYQIADFKVGFESEGWEIYAYVDNLTDERAVIRDWTGEPQGPVSLGRPRSWGLGFSMSWDGN